MFLTTAAAAPRRTWTSSPSPGGGPAGLATGAGALGAPVPDAAGGGGGRGLRRCCGRRGSGWRSRSRCGRLHGDRSVARRLGVVVDQKLMPARVDRGGVFAKLAVHLLDQPFVLPEWRTRTP